MDPRTRALIFGVIALVVLAALISSIIYLGRASKNTSNTNNPLPSLPVVSAPAVSGPTGAVSPSGNKTYAGQGFTVSYPAGWGLLTCSNSQNFEFDPGNNQDIKGVVCDRAVKPITVLVEGQSACRGQTVQIGSHKAVKSKVSRSDGGTDYRWCVPVNGKVLDITERVSPGGFQATSPTDYSGQVEEMIKNITATPNAS